MKNIIITGANSGLGFNTALKIANASDEYNIILACRNLKKARIAQSEIIEKTGNSNIDMAQLDVSSMSSVREFVDNLKYDEIYALVCNAGIGGFYPGITEDGFDIVFATNHLGHFLLSNLLLDKITDKLFVVSSDMHNPPSGIKWINPKELAYPDEEMSKSPKRYFYSKLCNLYFVYELDLKTDILVNAFNPGLMRTNFSNIDDSNIEFVKKNMPNRLGDLEKSSQALSELIISDDLSVSGKYFDRSTNFIESSQLSYNKDNSKELWEFSKKITKLGDD